MRFTTRWMLILCACVISLTLQSHRAFAIASATRTAAFSSCVQVIAHTRFGTTRRCSGYLFSTQGLVATDYHAVSDATSIQIFQADLGVLDVSRIRRVDPRTNLAVLSLAQGLDPSLPLAYSADIRDYQPGEAVHVLHHAQYRDELLTDTTVIKAGYPQLLSDTTFTKHYAQDAPLIAVNGPFDAGSAGGIVLDENWNVAGLLVGSDEPGPDGKRTAYAVESNYLTPLLRISYDIGWKGLETSSTSDAALFDPAFGPGAPLQDFSGGMDGGYLAWFSPIYPAAYSDSEFTSEINDKIKKNWFQTSNLTIDNRPLREFSASRVVVWGASANPWNLKDGSGRYMHFDADSLFSKRVYKERQTEERIMTRYILAMQLTPGTHNVQYENKAANFKAVGIKHKYITIDQAEVQLIDIQGLSLVQMDDLPAPQQGIGEGAPVKYVLTRRPLGVKEIGYGIRSGWYKLKK